MSQIPHEHDDEGNCIPPEGAYMVVQSEPVWKFSLWDVAGVGIALVGGLFSVTGQGFALMSTQCQAMANWKRQTWDIRAAEAARREQVEAYEAHQREMAAELARITGLDTPEEGP
jgi:hypothetical protein